MSTRSILNEPPGASAPPEPQVTEAIRRIAESECPVLILGERGVGKTATATLLHSLSPRSGGLCRTLSGQEATREKLRSALPGSGTLVLIEAAELPMQAQEELVRHSRDGIAANRNRLICTTERDLETSVLDGRVREDFYYLISAVSLRVSPLRHRKEELLALADSMLERYARQYDRPKPMLTPEIRAFLLKHSWPGNLEELELSMKACVVIGDADFSLAAMKAAAPRKSAAKSYRRTSLKAATRAASIRVERQLIAEALAATAGNRKQTAKELRISYKTLLYKLKQSGLASSASSSAAGASL